LFNSPKTKHNTITK